MAIDNEDARTFRDVYGEVTAEVVDTLFDNPNFTLAHKMALRDAHFYPAKKIADFRREIQERQRGHMWGDAIAALPPGALPHEVYAATSDEELFVEGW